MKLSFSLTLLIIYKSIKKNSLVSKSFY